MTLLSVMLVIFSLHSFAKPADCASSLVEMERLAFRAAETNLSLSKATREFTRAQRVLRRTLKGYDR